MPFASARSLCPSIPDQQLELERREETLGHRIVVTVAFATHARHHLVRGEYRAATAGTVAESFFATCKVELVYETDWATRDAATRSTRETDARNDRFSRRLVAMPILLQTTRLLLRPLETGDLDALHAITSDPTVMQFVGDLKPFSREQTERMIRGAEGHYRTRGFGEYAIVAKEDALLAGYAGFAVVPEHTGVEIDYVFRRDFWGRGMATELAVALVDYAFLHLALDAIGASFDPQNEPSMRVARKVGLQYERTGFDEHGLPTVYYMLTRAHWTQPSTEILSRKVGA